MEQEFSDDLFSRPQFNDSLQLSSRLLDLQTKIVLAFVQLKDKGIWHFRVQIHKLLIESAQKPNEYLPDNNQLAKTNFEEYETKLAELERNNLSLLTRLQEIEKKNTLLRRENQFLKKKSDQLFEDNVVLSEEISRLGAQLRDAFKEQLVSKAVSEDQKIFLSSLTHFSKTCEPSLGG